MSPEELRTIIRKALNDSLEVSGVSTPDQEDDGDIYVEAVDGTDFVIHVEVM